MELKFTITVILGGVFTLVYFFGNRIFSRKSITTMTPDWEKEYQEYLNSLKEDFSDYLHLVKKQVDHGELTVNRLIEWGKVAKQKQDIIKIQENLLKKLKQYGKEQKK